MTLYVYNPDTFEAIATFDGETNEECEAQAAVDHSDTDYFAWSYSPDGLNKIDNEPHEGRDAWSGGFAENH